MAAGKEIERLRKTSANRLSVAKAASLIGVDSERLRKWEQRDADPSDATDIEKIETYFHVALDKLKDLDNFQFYKRANAGKDAFIEIATKMHEAGHFNKPIEQNEYVQSLKAQILLLEKINEGLEKRIDTIEINLKKNREYLIEVLAQVKAGSKMNYENWAGLDNKKKIQARRTLDSYVGEYIKEGRQKDNLI